MSNFELQGFADDGQLASAVAGQWLVQLQANLKGRERFCVALSGGRIAKRFFTDFAALAKASPASIDRLEFFWADERCVPPDDPESNFRLARELLLEPLSIPADRIHRIEGESSPDLAAVAAKGELCRLAPRSPSGQPQLDLVFLGMGENGHIASLFPEEPEEVRCDPAVYRAVTTTKPPPRRITLGYAAIAEAVDVWVLASGAGKEDAFRESLKSQGTTPLARVLRLRKSTKIFTDIKI